MAWRDLFDVTIVSARKPDFFSQAQKPLYELADPDAGLMREVFRLESGHLYAGGSARMVEKLFGCSRDEMLYVGDHIFTDLNHAQATMRWRTALVVQELEKEIEVQSSDDERRQHETIVHLLGEIDHCSNLLNQLLTAQRRNHVAHADSCAQTDKGDAELTGAMEREIAQLQMTKAHLEAQLAPLLFHEGRSMNPHWGYMARAGFADKSHFMRQIEKYADVYTSRVSNLLHYTPEKHFQGYRQGLAHEAHLGRPP